MAAWGTALLLASSMEDPWSELLESLDEGIVALLGAAVVGLAVCGAARVLLHRRGRAAGGGAARWAAHLLLACLAGGAVLACGIGSAGIETVQRLREAAEEQKPVRVLLALDPHEAVHHEDHGGYWTAPGQILRFTGAEPFGPCRVGVTLLWGAEHEGFVATAEGESSARRSSGSRLTEVVAQPMDEGKGRVLRALTLPQAERVGEDLADGQPSSARTREDGALGEGHRAVSDLRERFADIAEDRLGPAEAALVKGMTYGDDEALPSQDAEALKVAGLTHLTAVSGSNVAVVFLMGLSPWRWLRAPQLVGIVSGLMAVGGYVLLVGPEPSILRAACMGTLAAAAIAVGRPGGAGAALWCAVILLLCLDPLMASEPGFILSVLATTGIVVQGRILRQLLVPWMPLVLAEVLSLTLIAALWCAPYLVAMTGYLGTYTALANVLVAPIVAPVTVLGVMAVITVPATWISGLLIQAAGFLAGGVRWVGLWTAGLPGSTLEVPRHPGPVLLILGICALLIFLLQRVDPARRALRESLPDNLHLSVQRPRADPTPF